MVKAVGHSARRLAAVAPTGGGAQEKTRTSTSFRPLEPESSASTNSATWASRRAGDKPGTERCQRKSQDGFDNDLDRILDALPGVFESSRQLIQREGVGMDQPGVESLLLHQRHGA